MKIKIKKKNKELVNQAAERLAEIVIIQIEARKRSKKKK